MTGAFCVFCAIVRGEEPSRELKPLRVGFVVSGFGVSHAHVIVLPLHDERDITSARFARLESGEIHYSDSSVAERSRAELDSMAERLRSALRRQRG